MKRLLSILTLALLALPSLAAPPSSSMTAGNIRRAEGYFECPSISNPIANDANWNISLASKFGQWKNVAVRFGILCNPPVVGLLLTSGPSTVSGFIAFGIVDAFNSKPVWSDTHFREECCEGRSPQVADIDSSPPVFRVILVVGIVAPVVEALPDPMCAGTSHAVGSRHIIWSLSSQASAALCVSGSKASGAHNAFFSTVANANPPCRPIGGSPSFCSKSSESHVS